MSRDSHMKELLSERAWTWLKPTRENLELDPLAAQHLDIWLYMFNLDVIKVMITNPGMNWDVKLKKGGMLSLDHRIPHRHPHNLPIQLFARFVFAFHNIHITSLCSDICLWDNCSLSSHLRHTVLKFSTFFWMETCCPKLNWGQFNTE